MTESTPDPSAPIDSFADAIPPPAKRRGRPPKVAAPVFAGRDRAGKLESLTDMSLDWMHSVLTAKPAKDDPAGAKALEDRKERIVKQVLTVQARVDETRLQEKVRDRLEEVLKGIKDEASKRIAQRSLESLAVNGN